MKVLVGIPASFHKEYCLEEFSNGIKKLTYPKKEIIFIDNSPHNNYIKKINCQGFNAIKGPYFDSPIQRISASRNVIIEKATKENFDYILFLDQDTIPPKDSIERFLKGNKPIICGVYFSRAKSKDGKLTYLPSVYKVIPSDKELPDMIGLSPEEIASNRLLNVISCGGGCIFASREVFTKIRFREDLKQCEDRWFCIDLYKNKIPLFCDTSVKCKHLVINRTHVWKDGKLILKPI
ncbi:glycosyltransferase [Candidatus Woesearchaeota archaeon]|nr:glycosyltransferase [Candidatus Woesearchaeota archaeon]